MAGKSSSDALTEALARARAQSPFLARLAEGQPDLCTFLAAGEIDACLDHIDLLRAETEAVGDALRRERAALALVAGIADLAGVWSLADVTSALSAFADDALDRAIAAAIVERMPDAEPRGFAVIGLGKHGGRELNYSSDIDPIFLFDPETLPHREREEPVEAAVRYGRRVIQLLTERTHLGYVFRVDMRLRPSPEVSPIALPVDATISYYESSAVAWEQAAFIRARAAAGDRALGERFLTAIRPFVWRRSLDFGQVRNIAEMSAAIRDHHGGQRFGPGYDLKRGRGGIRESEFFAQVHQLIHGGREPALRVPDTRAALAALSDAGKIDGAAATALAEAYAVLRTIEHRVQMVDDRQTHVLPPAGEALDNVAKLHGLPDGAALLDLLRPHVEAVGHHYDLLIADAGPRSVRVPDQPDALDEWLGARGFADQADAARRVGRWRSGQVRAIRSGAAREAFEAVLPGLLTELGQSPDPARAIARFDNMVEQLPSAINFFRLIEARPGLFQLIGDLLSHAPVLADALGRRAELIEGLVDTSALELPGSVEAIAAAIRPPEGADYQDLLDHVRARVGEVRFALGVQLVEGRHDPRDVSAGYARVAEAAIDLLTRATVQEFERVHGQVSGGELLILALGRMGGQALTHASDLDLIFLFSGDHMAESDGGRPLGATQYFNRLSQRVIAALSVPTAAGPLYEVDTRLRPSGAQGMLAVSLDSFARYQREDAWTFEHQALTRARPLFGSDEGRAALAALVDDILLSPRDAQKLTTDMAAMRAEMAAHKPPAGPLDVKLAAGGLVDIEFLAQQLQLLDHVGLTPCLAEALAAQVAAGKLPEAVAEAEALFSRLLPLARLVAPDSAEPPEATQALLARLLGADDWAALLARIATARQDVVQTWEARFPASAKDAS